MSYQKFIALVAEMRSIQKAYEKYPTHTALEKLRTAQRRVDDALIGLAPVVDQGTLFAND